MEDIVVGLLAVVAGLVFCLRGYLTMRLIIPIWGFFAGFVAGAGLVAAIAGEGFLATALGWVVGGVVAVLFAALAYLYYELSVLLGMTALGFALGSGLMGALGVRWSWVGVLVGVAFGIALAIVALVADVPTIILVVLTALAGAAATVFGVMLLAGTIEVDDLDLAATSELVAEEWWTYALYVVLAVIGIVAQSTMVGSIRRSLREQWAEAGGAQLRP